MAIAGRRRKAGALAAVAELRELVAESAARDVRTLIAQASTDLLRPPVSDIEAWVDFELRSAEYYSQLAEVDGQQPDLAASEGFLPSELAERVHAQPLDDTHRRVSLRGYQSFGARFALAQRRVVLGMRWASARPSRPSPRWPISRPRTQPLPGGLSGERADQLDPRDPRPQHPARPARARPGPARRLRGVA